MDERVFIGSLEQQTFEEKTVREILLFSFERDLTVEELKILSFSDKKLWPLIIETAGKIKKLLFSDSIYFYVPLYVSSYCINNCLYCDYRRSNKKLLRKRLNFEEFKQEVNYLYNKGYKGKIELVAGSDPAFRIEDFAKYVQYTKDIGVKEVLMNNRVMSFQEYQKLKDSGLDWSWLWIESYDENFFGKYHPKGGEKNNFKARLDSYDAAAEAGLNIGLGVLLGLSPDWRLEILSSIAHGKYLAYQYKIGIVFGTPRFCAPLDAPISTTPCPDAATDDIFRLMVALYRLGIRKSYIDGTTRENIDMLRKLWQGGGNLANPEVKTIPGGYTLKTSGAQFSHNSYSLEYFISEAKKQGLNPKY